MLKELPPRVIPCLLLYDDVFVKTKKFTKTIYIGDPINTISLFNKFEVDEIMVLDIGCARKKYAPNFSLIEDLASECWVPLSYGGGIQTLSDAKKILNSGIEKIIVDRLIFSNPQEVQKCVNEFGASSVVACINIKKTFFGTYQIRTNAGRTKINLSMTNIISHIKNLGVGELIINDISRDGTRLGYDFNLIKLISNELNIPVIIIGGADTMDDFKSAVTMGASAIGAGSYFVFQNKSSSSVLVNFPNRKDLERLFNEQ